MYTVKQYRSDILYIFKYTLFQDYIRNICSNGHSEYLKSSGGVRLWRFVQGGLFAGQFG